MCKTSPRVIPDTMYKGGVRVKLDDDTLGDSVSGDKTTKTNEVNNYQTHEIWNKISFEGNYKDGDKKAEYSSIHIKQREIELN